MELPIDCLGEGRKYWWQEMESFKVSERANWGVPRYIHFRVCHRVLLEKPREEPNDMAQEGRGWLGWEKKGEGEERKAPGEVQVQLLAASEKLLLY